MSPTRLLDTHVHLDFLSSPAEAVRRAEGAGVGQFVVPGVNRRRWPALLALAQGSEAIRAAPGLHPQAAAEWDKTAERDLKELLGRPEAVAVGEIGLDRSPGYPLPQVQEAAFRGQLRLALEAGLPVLIHCRRATERVLRILEEEGAQRVGGLFHAFSGSLETARAAIRIGFGLGFGGPLTWPGARRGPQVLRQLPAEWIVLETDAPDLPPHPCRGEANRPEWLPLVAGKAAEIRGWSLEETARRTTGNARRILKI